MPRSQQWKSVRLLQVLLLWLVCVSNFAFPMDPERVKTEIITSLERQGETCEQVQLVSGVVQDFSKKPKLDLTYTDPETGNATKVKLGLVIWPEDGSYSLLKRISMKCSDGMERDFALFGCSPETCRS